MRSVPKQPDTQVNVSPIHPLHEGFVLLVGLCLVAALVFSVIAFSVDLLVPLVSPELEAELLEPVWRQIERQMGPQGLKESEALTELLLRVAGNWEDSPYDFRVGIWKEEGLNAFALPGGAILVTSGLLEKMESENELAFVLAHELGHFYHRDHLRALGRGMLINVLLAFTGLGGGESVSLLGNTGLLAERSFSRDQEGAADRFGFEMLYQTYGHVAGGSDFFSKLPDAEQAEGSFSSFTQTHPVSKQRIDALENLAKQKGWPLRGELSPTIKKEK